MKAVYKATDGSEHDTAEKAAQRNKYIEAVREFKIVAAKIQKLKREAITTADGRLLDSSTWHLWYISRGIGSLPRLREVALYSFMLEEDGGDIYVMERKFDSHDSGITQYRIRDLYADKKKAMTAHATLCQEWLAETAKEVAEIVKQSRSEQ